MPHSPQHKATMPSTGWRTKAKPFLPPPEARTGQDSPEGVQHFWSNHVCASPGSTKPDGTLQMSCSHMKTYTIVVNTDPAKPCTHITPARRQFARTSRCKHCLICLNRNDILAGWSEIVMVDGTSDDFGTTTSGI